MLKFKHALNSVLNKKDEEQTSSVPCILATEATDGTDEISKETTSKFAAANYQEILSAFSWYDNTLFPFPSEMDFKNLLYTTVNDCTRNTKDPAKYPKIMEHYPLLDLFALWHDELKKGAGGNSKEATDILKDFFARLTASSKIPLEFQARSQWAKDVKQKYYEGSKTDFGKARLENVNQELGIYSAVLYLLAIRRDMLKPSVPVDKIPPANDYIKKIFFDPQVYVKGNEALPSDEKIKLVYTETTAKQLIDLSRAIYNLFAQQRATNVGEREIDEQKAYERFMGAGTTTAAEQFSWSDLVKESIETGLKLTDVDSFNSAWKHLNNVLNEKTSPNPYEDGNSLTYNKETKEILFYPAGKHDSLKPPSSKELKSRPLPPFQTSHSDVIVITIKDLETLFDTDPTVKQEVNQFAKNANKQANKHIYKPEETTGPSVNDLNINRLRAPTEYNYKQAVWDYFYAAAGDSSTEEKSLKKLIDQQMPFSEGKFLYNLKTIKDNKDNVPQAEILYQKLVGFADFIQQERKLDMQQVAQGAKQISNAFGVMVA